MTRNLCFTDAEVEEGGARMLLTPADRGPGMQPAMGRPALADAWLAAPVSELSAPISHHRATTLAYAGAPARRPFGGGAIGLGLAESSVLVLARLSRQL